MRVSVILFMLLSISAVNVSAQTYKIYVAAESDDEVSLVSFDSYTEKATIDQVIKVGEFPTETEGPHGIGISPSGDYLYVSLGHGMPFGHLYKYRTGSHEFVDRTELGMFPATLDVSSKTGWVYVVNFNLHGDHEVSSVSVVDGESMAEIERIETGIMPHGSRLTADEQYQYHVSMMTDELFEIDAMNLTVSRVLNFSQANGEMNHSGNIHSHDEMADDMDSRPRVKPTWASPGPVSPYVYIAGNGNDKIYEVNREEWNIERLWNSPGKGPYNLEPTPNGKKLVVTYKGEGATGIWDIEKGEQIAKISNSRKVTHGVVISPDNRYAFVSVEGIGGEPGSVDIIDLETLTLVEVVETGKQASGITFWKTM